MGRYDGSAEFTIVKGQQHIFDNDDLMLNESSENIKIFSPVNVQVQPETSDRVNHDMFRHNGVFTAEKDSPR